MGLRKDYVDFLKKLKADRADECVRMGAQPDIVNHSLNNELGQSGLISSLEEKIRLIDRICHQYNAASQVIVNKAREACFRSAIRLQVVTMRTVGRQDFFGYPKSGQTS